MSRFQCRRYAINLVHHSAVVLMLHLIKINLVIYLAVAVAIFAFDKVAGHSIAASMASAARAGGIASLIALAATSVGARFIPFVGLFAFPDLSGKWSGQIEYGPEGERQTIDATLNVEQNLQRMSLLLSTAKAESSTLVVHPQRLSNGRQVVHYIYETRSRPGQPPPGYKYQGTGELRVENDGRSLIGSYYTEQFTGGAVSFTRSSRPSLWQKLRSSKSASA